MSTGFRHADHRYPFLWESAAQPAGRWHADGDGPCQYLADTPDGAWAEFLRHEEITDPDDLPGITRSLWAVEVPDPVLAGAHHAAAPDMTGGPASLPVLPGLCPGPTWPRRHRPDRAVRRPAPRRGPRAGHRQRVAGRREP